MSKNENIRRYRRTAMPLQQAVEGVTRTAFRKRGIAEARIITEWPHIIGALLTDKTLPTRILFSKGQRDNGTLHLTVAPGWALEVQHLEPLILDKIATFFGYRAVARLHLTQAPLPAKPPRVKKTFAPLDAEQQADIRALTAQVNDPALRRALESLGEAIARDNRNKNV